MVNPREKLSPKDNFIIQAAQVDQELRSDPRLVDLEWAPNSESAREAIEDLRRQSESSKLSGTDDVLSIEYCFLPALVRQGIDLASLEVGTEEDLYRLEAQILKRQLSAIRESIDRKQSAGESTERLERWQRQLQLRLLRLSLKVNPEQ